MKKYTIKWAEFQNEVCQWVEVFCNNIYVSRILVGRKGTSWEQSEKDMVDEYFNSVSISNMF